MKAGYKIIYRDVMYLKVIEKMIEYFGNDMKRVNHSLKVWAFSSLISERESINSDQRDIINYAFVLHDIGIKEAERKYNSSGGRYKKIEGPSVAGMILHSLGIKENIIERVCFIIGNHHSYDKIDGIDFQVIVEADFLVNIFEDSMNKKTIEKIKKTSSGQYQG